MTAALKGWGRIVRTPESGNLSRTRHFVLDTGERVFASGLVRDPRNVNGLKRTVLSERLRQGITDPDELFRQRGPRMGGAAR
jgi:hypothetical protein